ncbi:glycoside hydrolase family 17 protein [Thalassotalea agarivorans]|uniref:Endo-1,3-beta-glucanase btgC n=1 Tax=Thalassotalea agarivorans TaxID=349064 RepID=A0A1I0DQ75_THASX|nr:glycosyl hydrolase family 17 protein [Thalassotalea agarivorans]SET34400.1 Exo-beta-1,3-glucanase, GH17 family [Thalassotalea agarivorans]
MSKQKKKYMSLTGMNVIDLPEQRLKNLTQDILEEKIHGISFSPYGPEQKPGDPVDKAQIEARLAMIAPNVKWIRSFSCSKGNELIPQAAKEIGLKTLVGAWLDDDLENNEKEIDNLIKLGKAGLVDIAAVGNEVLLREELSESQLIEYIQRVKAALPDIEVGYVDAYYEFEDHPEITKNCDVILANCYPFWEGCALEYSILYMKDMYRRARRIANGKKVIITETGWPDQGPSEWGAVPSYSNAMKYFIGTYQWAGEDNIDVFYFSSFNESWKVEDEGGVGAHWGLWDTLGNYKFA